MLSKEVYKEFKNINDIQFSSLINYLNNHAERVLGKIGSDEGVRVYHILNNTLKCSYNSYLLYKDKGNLELKVWGINSEKVLDNLIKVMKKREKKKREKKKREN